MAFVACAWFDRERRCRLHTFFAPSPAACFPALVAVFRDKAELHPPVPEGGRWDAAAVRELKAWQGGAWCLRRLGGGKTERRRFVLSFALRKRGQRTSAPDCTLEVFASREQRDAARVARIVAHASERHGKKVLPAFVERDAHGVISGLRRTDALTMKYLERCLSQEGVMWQMQTAVLKKKGG